MRRFRSQNRGYELKVSKLMRKGKKKDSAPHCLLGVSILAFMVGDSFAPQIVSELASIFCELKLA